MNKEEEKQFDEFMIEEYGKWKIGRAEAKQFINTLLDKRDVKWKEKIEELRKIQSQESDEYLISEKVINAFELNSKIDKLINQKKLFPCPHGREPMNGQDGWKHCPHCLGVNSTLK